MGMADAVSKCMSTFAIGTHDTALIWLTVTSILILAVPAVCSVVYLLLRERRPARLANETIEYFPAEEEDLPKAA
jgi:hypothetical protein